MSVDPAPLRTTVARQSQDRMRAGASLERLRLLLLDEGGLMASMVGEPSSGDRAIVGPYEAGPAQLAGHGPRVDGRAADYELLIEAIYEGYLLHYRAPRVVQAPENDLALLAGDRLYALGLALLVRLGDVEAVAELADVITLSALAQASGDPELADAVWRAGARAVGWGSSPHHERAKALVRAASPDAHDAMHSLGLELRAR
jgi:hypothetical protein